MWRDGQSITENILPKYFKCHTFFFEKSLSDIYKRQENDSIALPLGIIHYSRSTEPNPDNYFQNVNVSLFLDFLNNSSVHLSPGYWQKASWSTITEVSLLETDCWGDFKKKISVWYVLEMTDRDVKWSLCTQCARIW